MKAILALEDGTQFVGESFGATGSCLGETVFNTGMTGYEEALTLSLIHILKSVIFISHFCCSSEYVL